MKLKNKHLIELAKFFLFDESSIKIQYKFDVHEAVKNNINIFREVYSMFSDLEKGVISMKSSDLYISFFEDLKVLAGPYLKKQEDGSPIQDKSGVLYITDGMEDEVMKLQNDLADSEKYKSLIDSMKEKESTYRSTLEAVNSSDVAAIPVSSINSEDLTLNSSQWEVLSLILAKDE